LHRGQQMVDFLGHFAQKQALYVGVVEEFSRSPGIRHLSGVHHVAMVGGGQGARGFLFDRDHGQSFGGQGLQTLEHLLHQLLVYDLLPHERHAAIGELGTLLEASRLAHAIGGVFPLSNIVAAHETVEAGDRVGNVVVRTRE